MGGSTEEREQITLRAKASSALRLMQYGYRTRCPRSCPQVRGTRGEPQKARRRDGSPWRRTQPRPRDDPDLPPDYRIRAIVPKRPKAKSERGRHGALSRAVLDALRRTASMTARDLVEHVLAARGVVSPDANRIKYTTRAVNVSLASLAKRGLAASEGDMPRRWAVASSQKFGTTHPVAGGSSIS